MVLKERTKSIEKILGEAGLIGSCCDGGHYDTESDSAKQILRVAREIYNLGYQDRKKEETK